MQILILKIKGGNAMAILKDIRMSPPQIIGEGRAIKEVQKLISVFAETNDPVLITGESGTGKELVAKALHCKNIDRKDTLVTYNMAAANKELFANELFGHEKGAFTGAFESRSGLAEQADGGTLFLDEIGELPPEVQAHLLRFLESGEIGKLSEKLHSKSHVDVRIIAATNTDLLAAVENKKFREDVFYRLSCLRIHLPSLRKRKEDIPLLANYFLQELITSKDEKTFSESAIDLLMEGVWPGNIRQLKFSIHSAVRLAGREQEIRPEHFRNNKSNAVAVASKIEYKSGKFPTHQEYMKETEKRYALEVIASQPNYNRKAMSRKAGMCYKAWLNLLNRHELNIKETLATEEKYSSTAAG